MDRQLSIYRLVTLYIWAGYVVLLIFSAGARMPLPPAELPNRLLLLNFRALGSSAEVVYSQQWVNKRTKEIA